MKSEPQFRRVHSSSKMSRCTHDKLITEHDSEMGVYLMEQVVKTLEDVGNAAGDEEQGALDDIECGSTTNGLVVPSDVGQSWCSDSVQPCCLVCCSIEEKVSPESRLKLSRSRCLFLSVAALETCRPHQFDHSNWQPPRHFKCTVARRRVVHVYGFTSGQHKISWEYFATSISRVFA